MSGKLAAARRGLLWLLLGVLGAQCARLPGGRPVPRPATVRLLPGTTRAIRLRATLLLPTGAPAVGEVLVDTSGRIACVGPDCGQHPAARGASLLVAPGAVLSPGLLNAHDHLAYDHLAPLAVPQRYTNRQQWRLGWPGYAPLVTRPDSAPARLLWSELRQLLVGTTSIVGSSRAPGLLRNLDRADARLGLGGLPVRYTTFPLRNQRSPPPATACGYPVFELPPPAALPPAAFVPHVAEGTDQVSADEFRCLAGLLPGSQRLLPDSSALVHAIALSAADAHWLRQHQLSVVWSPRSNLVLYGRTAPVRLYDSLAVNLLLGTDWTPTGSATLPEELRYAAAYSQRQLHGYFSDRQLWQMVTSHAALGLHLQRQLGALAVGQWADLALYSGQGYRSPYQAVIEARPATTLLVLRAGQPLYGEAALLRRLPASRHHSPRLPLGAGVPPRRVYWPAEMPLRLRALRRANRASLPLQPGPAAAAAPP